jgi:hypothetical protein
MPKRKNDGPRNQPSKLYGQRAKPMRCARTSITIRFLERIRELSENCGVGVVPACKEPAGVRQREGQERERGGHSEPNGQHVAASSKNAADSRPDLTP